MQHKFTLKIFFTGTGSGSVVMGGDSCSKCFELKAKDLYEMCEVLEKKVLSSNPGTLYWMEIFHIYCVVKNCNVCLKRRK